MNRVVNLCGAGLLGLLLLVGLAGAASAGDAAAGKAVYTTNCVSCHGTTGKGDGPVGAALNPAPRDFSTGEFKFDTDKDGSPGTDADLTAVIKSGAAAYGGSPLMAPWGHLPDSDVANLVAYIRSLKQ
ncbi:MAG: cytochrome c [Myxococcota bacterium]|nr:cytochrome c [Myxococcota bacterium]